MADLKWYRDPQNLDYLKGLGFDELEIRGSKLSFLKYKQEVDLPADAFYYYNRRTNGKTKRGTKVDNPRGWRAKEYSWHGKLFMSEDNPVFFSVKEGQRAGSIFKATFIDFRHEIVGFARSYQTSSYAFSNLNLEKDYSGQEQRKFADTNQKLVNKYNQTIKQDQYVLDAVQGVPYIGRVMFVTKGKVLIKPLELFEKNWEIRANTNDTTKTINRTKYENMFVLENDEAEILATVLTLGA